MSQDTEFIEDRETFTEEPYVTPVGQWQILIANVMADVLRITRVGSNDNFTELGGSSLDAVSICSRLKRDANISLDAVVIVESDTVADIAHHIHEVQRLER
ncbi:phosphopantetheine-binding protein [Streptomyces sp. NPDC088812]|uniref:phosphopantetheine-binding protein n=1 Tax=Streptomyces sp. NPDC088812 TaxID=3365905 RepID=UPI00382D40D6